MCKYSPFFRFSSEKQCFRIHFGIQRQNKDELFRHLSYYNYLLYTLYAFFQNLFLFLNVFDGLFLIASGRSLGERATHTTVLREQFADFDSSDELEASAKKRVVLAVTVVLCISIPMFLIISTALNAVKKQDNYQIARSYLMNSNAYAEMQADESQITLTGYSSSTNVDNIGTDASTVVTFSFLVQGRQYQVVCHQNGDMWYVCSDCTTFQ